VVQWIKETEGAALKIVKSEDPLILRSLEQAIRLGQPVLIENVGEYLDPLLDPILLKEISIRGAQKILKLGDVEVEYNDSFRLYLVTSLPNPHYLPSAFIKINLINFTITFKCLFEQFLSLIVLKERPELERERDSLIESISKDFSTLRDLEDTSLNILGR
jgi:dynein heavy chain